MEQTQGVPLNDRTTLERGDDIDTWDDEDDESDDRFEEDL